MRQRARKDEDKQERRQAMVDVAWRMFQESPYSTITMADIAEKSGLAKGTVYLYFETREELFLAVQLQQLEECFAAVDDRLDHGGPAWTIDQIVALTSDSLRVRPALARLLALLPGVLEHNIDFDTALNFKRILLGHMVETGARLEKALPFLSPGHGSHLILRLHALVTGFQQMADPVPVLKRVLQEPDVRVMAIDFPTEFSETFRLLLIGMESDQKRTQYE